MNSTVEHDCDMRSIINLSGYRFVPLDNLPLLQADMDAALRPSGILGTILLAEEGINIALAGSREAVDHARNVLDSDPRFKDIWLKESLSRETPFAKLKVRIRHEIIVFDGAGAGQRQFERPPAPNMAPETVRQWLDEGRNFVLLDTRNDYEVEAGTFSKASHLGISHFRNFQSAIRQALASGELDQDTPVVTFCTGGVRCEKAAPWMLEQGFREVYQIEGGILNYFERCEGAYWEGNCFVFDDRVEVDPALRPTPTRWCNRCQRRVCASSGCECGDETALIGSH